MVLIETWNELHEGTDICDSKEFGRQYIELTEKYAKLFRDHALLPKTGPFANSIEVEWDAERTSETLGITIKNDGDGLWELFQAGDRKCGRTKQSEHGGKYIYLDLDDSFMYDEEDATLLVTIEYFDSDFDSFVTEYDGIDSRASLREGAFQQVSQTVVCGHTGKWKHATMEISGGRFANRCNDADFRLSIMAGNLAISQVTARRAVAN